MRRPDACFPLHIVCSRKRPTTLVLFCCLARARKGAWTAYLSWVLISFVHTATVTAIAVLTVGLVHDLNMQSRGLGRKKKKHFDAYGMYLSLSCSSVAKYGHATLVSDLHHERSSEREKKVMFATMQRRNGVPCIPLCLHYHVHGDLWFMLTQYFAIAVARVMVARNSSRFTSMEEV